MGPGHCNDTTKAFRRIQKRHLLHELFVKCYRELGAPHYHTMKMWFRHANNLHKRLVHVCQALVCFLSHQVLPGHEHDTP